MKYYFNALFAVFFLAALFVYLAFMQFSAAKTTKATLDGKRAQTLQLRTAIDSKTLQIQKNWGAAVTEDRILQSYEPAFQAMGDVANIQREVMTEAERHELPVLEQKTAILKIRDAASLASQDPKGKEGREMQSYMLRVAGPLNRLLMWLGVLEELYPLARVVEVTLKPPQGPGAGDDPTMTVVAVFPSLQGIGQ